MKLLKKLIDLILYSNLWIALGAMAMALQTQLLLSNNIRFTSLISFIFCSTLFLYAIHRIVGIQKVKGFLNMERFAVIASYKSHIIFYAIVAGLGSAFFFFQLEWKIWMYLGIPAFISLGYVLPVFGKQRRLRDFSHIKIYLIAISWAWITVLLVALEENHAIYEWEIIVLFVERTLFVFAITLPFDIRDLKVDQTNAVKTIPMLIGIKRTKVIAYVCLFLCCVLASINSLMIWNHMESGVALFWTYLATAILISYTTDQRHDYFYTGLVDGTMVFQFVIVYAVFQF